MSDEIEDFSPDAAEFRCLVPFPDGSASFAHGFEAGIIWQRMNAGEQVIGTSHEVATHKANEGVFRRMADAHGYLLEVEDIDAVWIITTFTKNPQKFRIVK